MTSYFQRLAAAKASVIHELGKRGVDDRHLHFGGPGITPGRISVPTSARSEFLANRAIGDWAETLLADAVDRTLPGHHAVHYGNSDRIAAGEDGFGTFYRTVLEDVRVFGKRPDLLIVPDGHPGPGNVSAESTEALRPLVEASLAAVEVRSSKYEALHYARVRAADREAGKKAGRATQSFTVKVEDLRIVYRWIETFRKPQAYCQVFFDSMFAINVLLVFEIIGSGKGFDIETPARNQGKSTITIPITSGQQVAAIGGKPVFLAEHHVTRLGRHDAYVRPMGGDVSFDHQAFLEVLLAGS